MLVNDEVVKFRGDKLYAPYFGKAYTFLQNAVPIVYSLFTINFFCVIIMIKKVII